MTASSVDLHPGYIAGRFYAAISPGMDITTGSGWQDGILFATPFSVGASITPVSLNLAVAGNAAAPSSPPAPGVIGLPAFTCGIYANSAGGRPTGAPVITVGPVSLYRGPSTIAVPATLTAGLYWAVTRLISDGPTPFPNLLSTSGASSGAAIMMGMAALNAQNPQTTAGLVLPVSRNQAQAPVTLSGTEPWQDAPTGTGAPVVWLGL